ncbi:hypothetical protein DLJ47_24755 [Micromonospora sp. S4605]|nr:hypothetical protein DLJ47_24755 [Micromonospora sp. S4605]
MRGWYVALAEARLSCDRQGDAYRGGVVQEPKDRKVGQQVRGSNRVTLLIVSLYAVAFLVFGLLADTPARTVQGLCVVD